MLQTQKLIFTSSQIAQPLTQLQTAMTDFSLSCVNWLWSSALNITVRGQANVQTAGQ